MMRLLLTILAALGFVWAALNNASAEDGADVVAGASKATVVAATPAVPARDTEATADRAPGPRQFGASRADARIVIEAKEESWVRVRDKDGALVFMRTMKPGETYRVPDREGLVLDSGNVRGLVLHVDGKPAPQLIGMVRRGIELDPEALRPGSVARQLPPKAPASEANMAAAPTPGTGSTIPEKNGTTETVTAETALATSEAKPADRSADAPVVEAVPQSAMDPALQHADTAAKDEKSDVPNAAAKQGEDPPVPSREMLAAVSPEVSPAREVQPEPSAPTQAAEDTRASPDDAVEDESPPAGPRHFAAYRHDARIVIEAKEESWIRISDNDGKLVFMRTMKPGETYRVPNRPGLLLESGNAKGLSLQVDGKPVPPLRGMVRRDIALDPETLPEGAVVRRQQPEPEPQVAAAEPAPKPAAASDAQVPQPIAATRDKSAEPARPLMTATLPGRLPTAVPGRVPPAATTATPATATPATATPATATPRPITPQATAAVAPRAAVAAPAHVAPAPKPAPMRSAAPAATVPSIADRPERATEPLTAANAVTPSGVIGSSKSRIGLEVNKGTLVRLSRPAATVFVADPEVADIQVKSAGLIYVLGKKAGETALYAVDDRDRVVLNTTLVVSHNVSRLTEALRAVAPHAAVDVISIDNSLILTGTVHSPVDAENIRAVAARFVPEKGSIINQLRVVAPNQINLRVRFAEVSKETLKQFGINWESIARVGSNFLFGFAAGRDFINAAGTFPRDGTNTFIASYTGGRQDINAAIDALATEGLITLLAEPNLTAMNGETASFLAGGEFPIPLLQETSDGNGGITIEFKTFGVSLGFTPHILDDGRINLRVRPEVSQLSSAGAVQISGFSIPALTTRRAETTVELASGQSFVIAGLLQNNTQQDISKVPLLGDMPVLGALFKSDQFRRNESELVIIVTPYIVQPVSANRIAAPTDGFVAPSDVERILGGKTYSQQLNGRGDVPRTREGHGLIGPSGFQID